MRVACALVVSLLVAAPVWAEPSRQGRAPTPEARAILRGLEDAFSAVADRVTPSVVNVSTAPSKPAAGEEGPGELYERFFRRRPPDARASGSGLIVDPKGYVLTNNHVIENAREITVRLSDSRKFSAKLIGRDPKTDLAVLKVEAAGPLPAAELGDSDRLRVGQWAIAIGNPFGLDRTVTVGIVSAVARNRVGVAQYENFIQTDASINPGNSGGPLLNLDGKVIGINTAIVSAGQGIGFAIPINEAKGVVAQLIAKGRVVRGWLGLVIQDVTDELGQSFGVKERQGVLVADVLRGGPADKAGLRAGDVVVEFGGVKVREVPDLQRRAAAVLPGQAARMTVIRDKKPLTLEVTVGEMPTDEPQEAAVEPGDQGLGAQLEPTGPDSSDRGLVITEVMTGGPADRAGLRRGDVILEVNRQPVPDVATLGRILAHAGASDPVLLYVRRPSAGGRTQYLVLERGSRP
jgi:Do/DeqQ family serine protease